MIYVASQVHRLASYYDEVNTSLGGTEGGKGDPQSSLQKSFLHLCCSICLYLLHHNINMKSLTMPTEGRVFNHK